MRRAEFIIVGALLLVLVFGMALVGQEEALEAKLDSLDSTLHGIHYFVDPWGTERQWLPELFAFMETIEDDLDLFETKAVADLADLEIDVAAVEAKLDDETRWTDDAELAIHEAAVIAEIDANEVKIDILTVNLATHDTDIKAAIATHDTEIKAATATHDTAIKDLIGSPAHVDLAGDLASIETKLDTEASFTSNTELAIHDSNIISKITTDVGAQTTALTLAISAQTTALADEIDINEAKIDTVISHVDGVEAKLDHSTYGLSALAVKIGTIDSKIGTIDTDVATIDNEVATIDYEVGLIEAKLDTLDSNLADVFDGTGGIFEYLEDIDFAIYTTDGVLDMLLYILTAIDVLQDDVDAMMTCMSCP